MDPRGREVASVSNTAWHGHRTWLCSERSGAQSCPAQVPIRPRDRLPSTWPLGFTCLTAGGQPWSPGDACGAWVLKGLPLPVALGTGFCHILRPVSHT